MGRKANPQSPVIMIQFRDSTRSDLNAIKEATEADTYKEVIRRAIQLYKMLIDPGVHKIYLVNHQDEWTEVKIT